MNNFNPNLIKRRGTPQLGGHTSLLNRNQPNGPVKIKNSNKYNNNNYIPNNNHNHPNKKKAKTIIVPISKTEKLPYFSWASTKK